MSFSERLLAWFDPYGRHDLPWQQNRSPYSVWLSEVMLQQTQVASVIPYFERFMARFHSPTEIADSPLDEVLALWSGLGYYRRGRNLHAAAAVMRDHHQGQVPDRYADLIALPGIGRSTAGAILAQAFLQRYPILDGNVKRVLCRYAAIAGEANCPPVMQRLWILAESLLPEAAAMQRYTQAVMDLGSLICRRHQPLCGQCPVREGCQAYQQQRVAEFPTPRQQRPPRVVRQQTILLLRDRAGQIGLEQRPPVGVWAGLWSLPEYSEAAELLADYLYHRYQFKLIQWQKLAPLTHRLSHFDWLLQPLLVEISAEGQHSVREGGGVNWIHREQLADYGVPTPIRALIEQYGAGEESRTDFKLT